MRTVTATPSFIHSTNTATPSFIHSTNADGGPARCREPWRAWGYSGSRRHHCCPRSGLLLTTSRVYSLLATLREGAGTRRQSCLVGFPPASPDKPQHLSTALTCAAALSSIRRENSFVSFF